MADKSGFQYPAALRYLIENPPLLEGESPEQFWSFFQAVVDEQKPAGIEDWMLAFDTVTKSWEEIRLKRLSVALVRGGMINALKYHLDKTKPTCFSPDIKGSGKARGDLALHYFSKQSKQRPNVVAQLDQYGIGLAELQAKATEMNRPSLQMLERMIAARDTGRRKLRKEVAQRQKKRRNGPTDLASDE